MEARKQPPAPAKFIAALLIVGGIAGVVTVLWSQSQILQHDGMRAYKSLALLSVLNVSFALTGWVGFELWTGKSRAYNWAKLALTLQIPKISIAGLTYQFYTALGMFFSFQVRPEQGIKLHFDFLLGSGFQFWILSEADGWAIGVNLIAIALLTILTRSQTRVGASEKSNFGLIGS